MSPACYRIRRAADTALRRRNDRRKAGRVAWAVFTQAQSPPHQDMFGRLTGPLGKCLLVTGTPFPAEGPDLIVKAAPAPRRDSLRGRLLAWFSYLMHALVWGAKLPRGTFLLAVTNPPLLPHLALLLHRVRGIRYGLLIWDIYPDHLVAAGFISQGHPLAAIWRALNRLAMRDAEVVITLGEAMAETLTRQLAPGPPLDKRIEVIPNWTDADHIRPLPKHSNAFAQLHDQVGKITVMYAGNVGASHGLEILADAAVALSDDSRISFMVIGDGLGLASVRQEADDRGPTNITFLPPQPWADVPEMLATGDIAVIAQLPGTEALSMPSKVYSSLAAGSALVALSSENGDLARLVIDHEVGLVSPQGDVAALIACLQRLTDGESELQAMRNKARRVAAEVFNGERAFQQFLTSLTLGARLGNGPEVDDVGGSAPPPRL